VTAVGGARAVPAGGGSSPPHSGGLGISLPALRPGWEVLPGLGQAMMGNTHQTTSQETWPEAEPWGRRLPLARAVVGRRQASALCKARAASKDAEDMDQRLSAFRFLLFVGHERAENRFHRRFRRDAMVLNGKIPGMA